MKLSSKALLATMSLPLVITGCSTMNPKQDITAADIQNHRWELVNINGEDFNPTPHQKRPFIQINDTFKTTGNAGCNNFVGQGELKDNQFRIDKMAMTMKMCIGDIMDFEQSISQSLQEWSQLTLDGNTLVIKTPVNTLTYQLYSENQ